MALDARSRASIYEALAPLIGEENANTLMTEFPSVEADELVTKQFLRAELAGLRTELVERMHQQTVRLAGALGASITVSTALLGTLIALD